MSLDRAQGRLHVRHEARIVRHVMVRGEERDRVLGAGLGDAKKTVQDRRSRPTAARLNDQGSERSLGEERRVEGLVRTGQDQTRSIWSHGPGDAGARLVEQGLSTHERAELLGPLVAGDPPSQTTGAASLRPRPG